MQLYSVCKRFLPVKGNLEIGDADNSHQDESAVSLHPRLQEGRWLPNKKELRLRASFRLSII